MFLLIYVFYLVMHSVFFYLIIAQYQEFWTVVTVWSEEWSLLSFCARMLASAPGRSA